MTPPISPGPAAAATAESHRQRGAQQADGSPQRAVDGGLPGGFVEFGDALQAGRGSLRQNSDLDRLDLQQAFVDVSLPLDDAASATLHWTWPIGDGWSYSSKVPLVTHDQGDTWAVAWKVGIIHPSLAAGDTLDATTVGATRADILGPHGVGLITERPVVRFGVDRLKVGAAQAPDSARRLAQLVGIDAAPIASHTLPTLTTIRQPLDEMTAAAADVLLRRANGDAPKIEAIVCPTTLVRRNSA